MNNIKRLKETGRISLILFMLNISAMQILLFKPLTEDPSRYILRVFMIIFPLFEVILIYFSMRNITSFFRVSSTVAS